MSWLYRFDAPKYAVVHSPLAGALYWLLTLATLLFVLFNTIQGLNLAKIGVLAQKFRCTALCGAKNSRTRVSSDKCLLLSLQNALLGDGVSFPGSVLLSCIVQYSQNRAISGHLGVPRALLEALTVHVQPKS